MTQFVTHKSEDKLDTPLKNRFRLNNNSDIPGKHRDVTPAEEAAYIASSKTNVAAPFKKNKNNVYVGRGVALLVFSVYNSVQVRKNLRVVYGLT